jgi:hypothetical protein
MELQNSGAAVRGGRLLHLRFQHLRLRHPLLDHGAGRPLRTALIALACAAAVAAGGARADAFTASLGDYLGPQHQANPQAAKVEPVQPAPRGGPFATLVDWNRIAVDASGLDHTPGDDDSHTFGQQLGPGRASRAMAIVHIAMFEAVNAIVPKFGIYVGRAGRRSAAPSAKRTSHPMCPCH